MPNLFIGHVDGDNLPAEDWNDNWEMVEAALFDLGPYVISGLVPSAGTGLAVDVTAGTASIGGQVTFAAFSIAGLTPSTLNHLYVLQDGTATSNTTGTAPALSAKIGTATTDATTVTAVDTSTGSGRQLKADLSSVLVSNAAQTITLDDAVATVSRPLTLRHSNSGGVGAAGLGAGLTLAVETATEGVFNTAAEIDARATVVTAGAMTGALDLSVADGGSMVTPLSVRPGLVLVGEAPTADADFGLLSAGDGGFLGGAGNFAGDADGTIYAANSVLGFTGDLINLQQGGVSRLRVQANGDAYMPRIPGVETTHGTLNIGHGPFDGATAGFFVGSSAGVLLAINSTSGFTGRLASLQCGGTRVLDALGDNRVLFGVNNASIRVAIGSSDAATDCGFLSQAPGAAKFAQVVRGAAAQTHNLVEYRSSADAVYGTISENGYWTTRKTAAPADAELATGEMALWFDATAGSAKLMIKAKNASGTVVTGSVALT